MSENLLCPLPEDKTGDFSPRWQHSQAVIYGVGLALESIGLPLGTMGTNFLHRHKDVFIGTKRNLIIKVALENDIPPELLAGILWSESGGDPRVWDGGAYIARREGWISGDPRKTSVGEGSIQARNAEHIIRKDPKLRGSLGIESVPTNFDYNLLVQCLNYDNYNIKVVGAWVGDLAKNYKAKYSEEKFDEEKDGPYYPLTKESIRWIGKWYNAGERKGKGYKDADYGDALLRKWPRFSYLMYNRDLRQEWEKNWKDKNWTLKPEDQAFRYEIMRLNREK